MRRGIGYSTDAGTGRKALTPSCMSLIPAETVVLSPPSVRTRPMDGRIVYWAITSALAGFLFGFDTVVISGAEQTIQSLWGLSPGVHGIAMGAALYGTVVGSLIGGWPADRFGREELEDRQPGTQGHLDLGRRAHAREHGQLHALTILHDGRIEPRCHRESRARCAYLGRLRR